MKRRLPDLALALAALPLWAPLAAVVALAVLCRDGRPVLFRQQRVGRNGRPFTLLKFRTMRQAAGAPITAADDGRITPLGRWLRRRHWDELPQLWNILRGEMSWIGPRPELPEFVAAYPAEFAALLRQRPGLVDAATFAWRNEAAWLAARCPPEMAVADFYARAVLPRKLRLARAHARRRRWWTDLALLARAAWRTGRP